MPNRITHNMSSAIAASGTLAAAFALGNSLELSVVTAIGCLSGIFLTPDMDILKFPRPGWNLSSVVRFFWAFVWSPYSKAIPHRSPFSHMPLLASLVRVLYAYGVYSSVVYIFGGNPFTPEPVAFCAFVLGLTVSDALHLAMDVASTWMKRRRMA